MQNSSNYFSSLNYTLANEDASTEWAILPEHSGNVLTVAGSGARVIPLLARRPKRLICSDISLSQLYLTELRLALVREAPLAEFLNFLGYPQKAQSVSPSSAQSLRKKWLQKLDLSKACRTYFQNWFRQHSWESFLYAGKWEKTLRRLSKVGQSILGKSIPQLFECHSLAEQQDFMLHRFPHRRWNLVISLLGNSLVFNTLLYRGQFPKKNIHQSWPRFFHGRYAHLFSSSLARENFFLQLSLLGELQHPEGNPTECSLEIYTAAQDALAVTSIEYVHKDIIEACAINQGSIDFVSLSDVPSYFSGETEKTFLQKMRPGLSPGAQVIIRNYLRLPENCEKSDFLDVSSKYSETIQQEKVAVYDIEVLKYLGGSF